jgi:GNAT superfamily N-acetyltransferase
MADSKSISMKLHRESRIAHDYWASHLGIPSERLFSEPLSIIAHSGELTGYGGVFALFRDGAKAISLPPERAEQLRPLIMKLPADFSPGDLEKVLRPFASMVIGPAFIGYTDSIPSASQLARLLTADDTTAVAALQAACLEDEWEHGGSDAGQHPAFGVFVEDQLAALTGYEIWSGTIAHISVITHPGHRGRGFGAAAVAQITAHALSAGLLPQYRTLDSNQPSMRIAERLGFHRYATSLAMRMGERQFHIRRLGRADVAAVRAMRLTALEESPTAFGSTVMEEAQRPLEKLADLIEPKVDDGSCFFGAYADGAMAGIVGFVRRPGERRQHVAELRSVYVLPEFRGRGVGRMLLETVLSHARSVDGMRQVILCVNAANQPARRLYQSLGFVRFGLEPSALRIDGTGHDEEHYILSLD